MILRLFFGAWGCCCGQVYDHTMFHSARTTSQVPRVSNEIMVEGCPPVQIIRWLKNVQSSPCTTPSELDDWHLTTSLYSRLI